MPYHASNRLARMSWLTLVATFFIILLQIIFIIKKLQQPPYLIWIDLIVLCILSTLAGILLKSLSIKQLQIKKLHQLLRDCRAALEVCEIDRNKFLRFFNLSLDMLCIAGTDGFFKVINPGFKALGYTKKDLLSHPFFYFIHPEDRLATYAIVGQLKRGVPIINFENRYCRKDGQYIWLSWTSNVDQSGNLYAIARDITHTKQTEEMLRQSEDRLAYALEVQELGAWTLNTKTQKSWRTLRHDQIFGYSTLLPEWTYEIFLSHILPGEREQVDRKYKEALASATEWYFTCRIRRVNDSSIRWIEVHSKPRMQKNEVTEMAGIIRDITESKEIELSLHEAIEARDEFLSIASHELKTPLTALILQLQLMDKALKITPMDSNRISSLNTNALKASQQAVTLLNDLLDITKMRAGKFVLTRQEVDLRSLATEAISFISEIAKQKGYQITLKANQPVVGKWDPNRIRHIISNLLSNSIKYGKNNPIEVSVKLHPTTHQAVLLVRDQGIGISPEILPKVFDRFERAVSEREFKGHGLGLYIARKIVEAHGGSIRVESELEKGSLFIVELPL